MTLKRKRRLLLKLSKSTFTPRRQKFNLIGQGKDFLQAGGQFDSKVLEDAIKECISTVAHEDVLLKDPDPSCKVYVLA